VPLAVESLTPASSTESIRNAISASIKKCMEEGRPQDQCAAIAYNYAREKTGRELKKEA